jgi:hypothetical protein
MNLQLSGTSFGLLDLSSAWIKVGAYTLVHVHYVTRHNKPFHNILSNAPQLNISQKALGTLLEGGSVMPKHVAATINN